MWVARKAPYRLVVEEREGYLFALLQGDEDNFDIALAAVTDLAAICRARKASKLLAEYDLPGRLTTLEVYSIAKQLPLLYLGIKVGFVIHSSQVPENPRFLEDVARNRGGTGQLFGSAREAEEWLRSR